MQRDKHSPRIGNGFVWTVSVVEGNILCDAVGDIALELVRSVAVAMVIEFFLWWYPSTPVF